MGSFNPEGPTFSVTNTEFVILFSTTDKFRTVSPSSQVVFTRPDAVSSLLPSPTPPSPRLPNYLVDSQPGPSVSSPGCLSETGRISPSETRPRRGTSTTTEKDCATHLLPTQSVYRPPVPDRPTAGRQVVFGNGEEYPGDRPDVRVRGSVIHTDPLAPQVVLDRLRHTWSKSSSSGKVLRKSQGGRLPTLPV